MAAPAGRLHALVALIAARRLEFVFGICRRCVVPMGWFFRLPGLFVEGGGWFWTS